MARNVLNKLDDEKEWKNLKGTVSIIFIIFGVTIKYKRYEIYKDYNFMHYLACNIMLVHTRKLGKQN